MPKILATDLDGTLFYPRRPFTMISKKNLKFVRDFIDDGNKLLLVTGRNMRSSKKVIKKINRDIAVCGCNSSLLLENNEIKKITKFDNMELEKFLDFVDKTFQPTTYVIMTKNYECLLYPKRLSLLTYIFYPIYAHLQMIYYEPFKMSKKIFFDELRHGDIYKVMIFLGIGKKAKQFASIANKYILQNKPFCESSWTSSSLELTPLGVNKASGIADYLKEHNYSKEDTYVVGDGGNDIIMFKEFYDHSFCMKKSMASVKKYSKYVINQYYDLKDYIDGNKK